MVARGARVRLLRRRADVRGLTQSPALFSPPPLLGVRASLAALDSDLHALGSALILRQTEMVAKVAGEEVEAAADVEVLAADEVEATAAHEATGTAEALLALVKECGASSVGSSPSRSRTCS